MYFNLLLLNLEAKSEIQDDIEWIKNFLHQKNCKYKKLLCYINRLIGNT